jgi:hypothetical protein
LPVVGFRFGRPQTQSAAADYVMPAHGSLGWAKLDHVKEFHGHKSFDTMEYYVKFTINDLKATHAQCHSRERVG